MFINIHTITDLPASCLNMDSSGKPKDIMKGGVRRIRISSQSLKRAYREKMDDIGYETSWRTRNISDVVIDEISKSVHNTAHQKSILQSVLGIIGNYSPNNDKGNHNLGSPIMVSEQQVRESTYIAVKEMAPVVEDSISKKAKYTSATEKKMKTIISSSPTVDQILFGRMFTNNSLANLDSAAQVAHSVGTGESYFGIDNIMSIDDRSESKSYNASYMEQREFYSGPVYGLFSVDIGELQKYLTDKEVESIVSNLIGIIPTTFPLTKSGSYGAGIVSDFVMISVSNQPLSFDTAFNTPKNSLESATSSIIHYANKISSMYGKDILGDVFISSTVDVVNNDFHHGSISEAKEFVIGKLNNKGE